MEWIGTGTDDIKAEVTALPTDRASGRGRTDTAALETESESLYVSKFPADMMKSKAAEEEAGVVVITIARGAEKAMSGAVKLMPEIMAAAWTAEVAKNRDQRRGIVTNRAVTLGDTMTGAATSGA